MQKEMRYEVRNEEIEKLLRDIAGTIGSVCPPGFGFTLLLYSFGDKGSMFYISNAQRESMIQSMQEFIQKFREN